MAKARRGDDRAQVLFNEHYASRARYEGDAEPKKDAASAKRVATGLRKAVAEFSKLLTPEQQKALADAAAVMRALGADLDKAGALALASHVAQAESDLRSRHAAADATAQGRWADDDEAMIAEARDLAAFVDQTLGSEWILKHRGSAYAHFPDDMPAGRRLVDALRGKTGQLNQLGLRRRAAEYLAGLRDGRRRTSRRYKDIWYVGLDDYEAWRAWRKEVLGAITPPLGR